MTADLFTELTGGATYPWPDGAVTFGLLEAALAGYIAGSVEPCDPTVTTVTSAAAAQRAASVFARLQHRPKLYRRFGGVLRRAPALAATLLALHSRRGALPRDIARQTQLLLRSRHRSQRGGAYRGRALSFD